MFGMVGGMMVYISLRDLLPTALRYDPEDRVTTLCLFIGMGVMAASLLIFTI
jgi:zinc transporter ZupT